MLKGFLIALVLSMGFSMSAPSGLSFYKGIAEDIHSQKGDKENSNKDIFITLEAKELGIETEGKEIEQLEKEVMEVSMYSSP